MVAVASSRKPFAPPVEQLNPDLYLPFVPVNESGVVYIFALAAERLGFNWAGAPGGLKVLEMRKLFGRSRDVFLVPYRDEFWSQLPDDRAATGLWSVPSTSGPDDLLLIYRPPEPWDTEPGAVTDVFRVATAPERVKKPAWRDEPDWMASIQRVARLRSPIPFPRLRELKAHGGIESRPRRTKQWPELYTVLVEEGHPTHSLRRFAPIA